AGAGEGAGSRTTSHSQVRTARSTPVQPCSSTAGSRVDARGRPSRCPASWLRNALSAARETFARPSACEWAEEKQRELNDMARSALPDRQRQMAGNAGRVMRPGLRRDVCGQRWDDAVRLHHFKNDPLLEGAATPARRGPFLAPRRASPAGSSVVTWRARSAPTSSKISNRRWRKRASGVVATSVLPRLDFSTSPDLRG